MTRREYEKIAKRSRVLLSLSTAWDREFARGKDCNIDSLATINKGFKKLMKEWAKK